MAAVRKGIYGPQLRQSMAKQAWVVNAIGRTALTPSLLGQEMGTTNVAELLGGWMPFRVVSQAPQPLPKRGMLCRAPGWVGTFSGCQSGTTTPAKKGDTMQSTWVGGCLFGPSADGPECQRSWIS